MILSYYRVNNVPIQTDSKTYLNCPPCRCLVSPSSGASVGSLILYIVEEH